MTELQKRIYTDESLYKRYEEACGKEYYKEISEKTDIAENAVVLPLIKQLDKNGKGCFLGGIIDENGSFFAPSAHIHDVKTTVGSLKDGYDFDKNNVVVDDRTVIYGGLLYKQFGHFLAESTNRLWYAIKHRELSYPIVFVKEKSKTISPQIIEFFELAGIKKERLIFIKKPTRFQKIIVPCQSNIFSCYYSDMFLIPYQTAATSVVAKPYDRIYLSRRKFKGNFRLIGEEKLEKAFKANGFKVLYPERLRLSEQISYIKGAKEIASVMGTATHLSLFANEGTKNIVLERSEDIIYEQILINQAVGLDWFSLCANLNYLPAGHEFSPILLGFTNHVAEFFKDNGYSFDKSDVNRISNRAVRDFNRSFFARYSSNKYNGTLTGMDPVYIRRIKKCCKTAFLSLRERFFRKQTDGDFRIFTLFGFTFRKRRKR